MNTSLIKDKANHGFNNKDYQSKADSSIYAGPPKVKFKFDKGILNMFIGYIFCDTKNISRMNLSNLQKLLEITDDREFMKDPDLYTRLQFARTALDAKLTRGMSNEELIKTYCVNTLASPVVPDIINSLDRFTQLESNEIQFLTEAVTDRLQYAFIVEYKDMLMDIILRMDTNQFTSYKEIVEEMKDTCMGLMNDIRKSDSVVNTNNFSLREEIFDALVEDVVRDASDPSNVLVTGLKVLNDMLSPGYMPGRLYLYLGCTGGWKSAMLLATCIWIKKYNRIIPKEKGKRPTVLYISNENTIGESVIRMWNMTVTDDDITNYTPKEVVKMMKADGGLVLGSEDDIDIVMQYYGNMEISTSDLYNIIEDLEDKGREVVCLVLDYIKRIRPARKALDERTQLAYVSNELKDLAVKKQIPVITAQQINRAGNMTVDAAMESGKEDLARFLGRGNIAQSWDMLENCDWTAILNIEMERSSGKRYLTIKEIKKRYKSMTEIDYMNQPFIEGSTIRLVEDYWLDKPVAKTSLASDLVGVNDKIDTGSRGEKNAKKRKQIKSLFEDDNDDYASGLFGLSEIPFNSDREIA